MKVLTATLLSLMLFKAAPKAQNAIKQTIPGAVNNYEVLKTESHISDLQVALIHNAPAVISNDYPVLLLHGSSFPSELAFGFRMDNYSWMDNLAANGYDVYALDFLGYGKSDRYPEMESRLPGGKPVGRALDVYKDVDKAIDRIMKRTGKAKVYLIGHSWGGSVAALYTEKFPDKVASLVLFAAITRRSDKTAYETKRVAFETMLPEARVNALKNLTPEKQRCQLEPEIFKNWGAAWLQSDTLAARFKSTGVRFPAGPSQDVEDMLHNRPYYNPAAIRVPVLLIRGEWDEYPNNADAATLFGLLENAPYKKYVVIEKGTHVMHLEKGRHELYDETLRFLKSRTQEKDSDKHPIAVIFEVIPADGQKEEYLDLALHLKPELQKVKGFISIERFQSISNAGKILSLSFWESEKAIMEWRNLEMHRMAQSKGREYIFKDYRLHIAQVVRDYGMFDRKEAPQDSKLYHK